MPVWAVGPSAWTTGPADLAPVPLRPPAALTLARPALQVEAVFLEISSPTRTLGWQQENKITPLFIDCSDVC